MKKVLSGLLCIIILFSFTYAEENQDSKINPEEYLQKADSAVKIDPDRSMDLAKSILLFLKGSKNNYFVIKSKLIIGKALFFKKKYRDSLKIFINLKARILLLRAENKGEKLSRLCSEAFYYLGNVYMKLSRYKLAIESYKEGLEFCSYKKDSAIKSNILVNISRGYLFMSDLEQALTYIIKGSKSSEKSGDIESLFFSAYIHGYICRELKDYSKGLKEFEKAVEIAKKYKRPDLSIRAINEISNIYVFQKKYKQALKLKKEAIKIAEQKNMEEILSFCLNDIGMIFVHQKDYRKALPYLKKSRTIAKKNSNIRGMIISDLNIAELYQKTGDIEKSFEILKKVIKLSEEHNLKAIALDASKSLSELLFNKKRFKEAYKYLKRSFKLKSEIFSLEKSSKIAELETETEMEKSTNKILLLEKINKIKQMELDEQNRFITLQKVTTFMLLIIVSLIFLAYRWKRKANLELREKSEELGKTLAEIQKLSGLLPICSSCKKIRDDSGYWHQVEEYIKSHSEASFSHSVCPTCLEKIYPKTKYGKSIKSKNKKIKK